MTKCVAGVYPGSGSGACFHSNHSCWLAPAHQGMKRRSCGLVQRIGTADSATPHPDPSGGQAPALHFLIPPSTIGLQIGTFRPCRLVPAHQGMKCDLVVGGVWVWLVPPFPLDSRFRENDEVGWWPAGAGLPRPAEGES